MRQSGRTNEKRQLDSVSRAPRSAYGTALVDGPFGCSFKAVQRTHSAEGCRVPERFAGDRSSHAAYDRRGNRDRAQRVVDARGYGMSAQEAFHHCSSVSHQTVRLTTGAKFGASCVSSVRSMRRRSREPQHLEIHHRSYCPTAQGRTSRFPLRV
jgi:hypothetical protein